MDVSSFSVKKKVIVFHARRQATNNEINVVGNTRGFNDTGIECLSKPITLTSISKMLFV